MARQALKEIVVVIAPPEAPPLPEDSELELMLIGRLGHLSVKDAASEVAKITKIPRKIIYSMGVRLQHELERENDDDDKTA